MSEPITTLLRSLDPRERLLTTPHYIERIAAGALAGELTLCVRDIAKVRVERARIDGLRTRRMTSRKITPSRSGARIALSWRGIQMIGIADRSRQRGNRISWVVDMPTERPHHTRRAAAREYLRYRAREAGRYRWSRCTCGGLIVVRWELGARLGNDAHHTTLQRWDRRPSREEIARAIRAHRAASRAGINSTILPSTLGWRAWRYDDLPATCGLYGRGVLRSPHRGDAWPAAELRCEQHTVGAGVMQVGWSDSAAVRGEAGIHARLMPHNWLRAKWRENGSQEGPASCGNLVTGVVERFGRYVLGTTGWRAEWVIIRELMAPDVPTMLALMQVYPDVRVHLSPDAPRVAEEVQS